jgi:prepilin peptidase CpaA
MLSSVTGATPGYGWLVVGVCWLVSIVLVVAAVIDGRKLKVPNWITWPLVLSGWIAGAALFGWTGLGWSVAGTAVGLGLLLPAYAIGGMGAGDVKLLAGVGAWIGITDTFWAFVISVFVGAAMSIAMILYRRDWSKHQNQFWAILMEILVIRNPTELSSIAADRKKSMLLLPYGIPIAIGTIAYFVWNGMML